MRCWPVPRMPISMVGVWWAVAAWLHHAVHADPPYLKDIVSRVATLPAVADAAPNAAPKNAAPLAMVPALAPALLMHHVEGVLLAKERLQQPVITQPVAAEAGPGTRWHALPGASTQVVRAERVSTLHAGQGAAVEGAAPCMADDGALLGLAFLLRVLGQTSVFDRVRWFAAVQEHYAAQRTEIAAAARPAAAQHVGAHHAALAIARVERYAEEYALVEQALVLARAVVDCS